MEGLVERLRAVISAEKLSIADFARLIGEKPQRIKDILRGQTKMPHELVAAIPEALLLNTDWWLYGRGEMYHPDRARMVEGFHRDGVVIGPVPGDFPPRPAAPSDFEAEYVRVPRYQIGAGAGGGVIVESEQIVDYLAFQAGWFARSVGVAPRSAALIEVRGDSMAPVLQDGELVIVDTSCRDFRDDAIYVLQYSGALRIKSVRRRLDGKIEIRSANEDYGVELLSEQEAEAGTFTIVGRARWALSGRRLP